MIPRAKPEDRPFTVSVVIPCRNAKQWIGRALASVADQAHRALEVILVDDGSTDDSAAEASRSGVDVMLLRGRWNNAAAARNAGIHAARGEWIAFLDADDVWYANHLARARELLGESGDVAFMANHDWIGEDDQVLPMPDTIRHRHLATATGLEAARFPDILLRGFHFGHSTVVVQRARSLEVGLFDESFVRRHDVDHWLRVISGRTWAYDSTAQAGYRVGSPGSLSKDVVRCEIFYLRALLKSLESSNDNEALRSLVRTSARRAMSLTFVDGTAEDYSHARRLAWAHLPVRFRVAYRSADLWPGLLRSAVRLKRALRSRKNMSR